MPKCAFNENLAKIVDISTLKARIKQQIHCYKEPIYATFSRTLTPTHYKILGVRIPTLRAIAKDIFKHTHTSIIAQYLKSPLVENYEQVMLLGMLTSQFKVQDVSQYLANIISFLPLIDNWAICDTFCSELKDFAKHCNTLSSKDKISTKRLSISVKRTKSMDTMSYRASSIADLNNTNILWDLAYKSAKNAKNPPFVRRFGLVILLQYFIDKAHIKDVLNLAKMIKSQEYYVLMANAWLLSVAFVKFQSQTEAILQKRQLDRFTQNKAISKICESLRVDKATKQLIKQYRIK